MLYRSHIDYFPYIIIHISSISSLFITHLNYKLYINRIRVNWKLLSRLLFSSVLIYTISYIHSFTLKYIKVALATIISHCYGLIAHISSQLFP